MNIELLKKYATDFLMSKARADQLPLGSDRYTRTLVKADIFADYMADEILNTGSQPDLDSQVKLFLSSIDCKNMSIYDPMSKESFGVFGWSIVEGNLQLEKAPF